MGRSSGPQWDWERGYGEVTIALGGEVWGSKIGSKWSRERRKGMG